MRLLLPGMIAATAALAAPQSPAVSIHFDYTYDTNNFFNTALKKDVLEAAGSFFSDMLLDDLDAIESQGVNSFNPRFTHPGTGATVELKDYSVAADTLVVFAGGRSLSGATLAQGGSGGYLVSGTQAFLNTVETRGEAGVDTDDPSQSTDFAPWGGSITFDTDAGTDWYFDGDLSTSADVVDFDFYSVALHELGHVLGYGPADSWDNQISGGFFTGPASVAVNDGNNVPLADGAHWQEGIKGEVNGQQQEANMDPSIAKATRKELTDLDLAGLSDIGWEVKPVPVPAALWLLAPTALGLLAVARRRA